jgi:hypothetical protein
MITLPRVIRAEWTKLCALRSTWIVLAATAVVVVGLAAAAGYAQHREVVRGGPPPDAAASVGGALLGIDLMSLVIGVFGVLLMTGEYSTGLIRATLAAVPRRLPVLWAKAVALVALATPVIAAAALGALLATRAFLGADGPSPGDPGVLRAALGSAAAAVATGLLGLSIGAMLRHTAGAITTLVAATMVVPALLPFVLPASVQDDVIRFVPTAAGQAMYAIDSSNNPFPMLSPAAGAAVLALWVVALLAGGAVVLRRRDA